MFGLSIRETFAGDYFKIVFSHRRRLWIQVQRNKYSGNSEGDKISCNKSRLLNHHRNVLHNKLPYKEPNSWIHLTEKYQQKMFGRYGCISGVSPNICFGIKSDKVFKTYFEELSETDAIHSTIDKHNVVQKRKIDEIRNREEEIYKKLEKLNQWKQELNSKIQKKEADAIAAIQKKDRLIEEVRRHFGYKIDPKDERFKDVLEQKEKEDKKKQREVKRKEKDQKLMSKLVKKSVDT